MATTVFAFVPMFFVTGVMGEILRGDATGRDCDPDNFALGSVICSAMSLGPRFRKAITADIGIEPLHQLGVGYFHHEAVSACGGLLCCMAITVSAAISFLLLTASLVTSGTVPSIFFPKLDVPEVMAKVIFPDGTPSRVTEAATERVEKAIQAINEKYSTPDRPLLLATHRMVGLVKDDAPGGGQITEGSHAGSVYAQLVDSGLRDVTSEQMVQEWREAVGPIAGVETLTFGSQSRGPGGKPIEFKLRQQRLT